ncbi:MAG: hypothetical protein BA874_01605 [Desulfuromonadales bacterium C00003068]|nr:MAG: hypothetical protein BA874_01605 [Desulfuromonadales bacterium C00003068]
MQTLLTEKQDTFAHGVVEGNSLADAYRYAYSAEHMKPQVIYVEASRLAANPKVALRLEELSREKDEDRRLQATKREDFVLDGLMHESRFAMTASARARALELIGKSIGLFTATADQKTEPKLTSKEIKEQLASKLEEYLGCRQTSQSPASARSENI